jgi:hypothetical protein
LATEASLLAWRHRRESPIVVVTTPSIFDAEGVATQVSVMPRSYWNEDPRFIETFSEDIRDTVRMYINGAKFSMEEDYILIRRVTSVPPLVSFVVVAYAMGVQHAAEIVDALTSALTMPEDLSAAIAWCKGMLNPANIVMLDWLERQGAANGSSRALHNQVACFIMVQGILKLEFRVRLVGLQVGRCTMNPADSPPLRLIGWNILSANEKAE